MAILGEKKEKKSYGKLFDNADVKQDAEGRVFVTIDAFDDDPDNQIQVRLSKACAAKNMTDNVAGTWLAATRIK
jgi:hypothetical protein